MAKSKQFLHNAVYIIFKLLCFYVDVEYTTSNGRIDLLMKTKDYIYILEFKINESAEFALKQIENKDYAKPFEYDERTYLKSVSTSQQSQEELIVGKLGKTKMPYLFFTRLSSVSS